MKSKYMCVNIGVVMFGSRLHDKSNFYLDHDFCFLQLHEHEQVGNI